GTQMQFQKAHLKPGKLHRIFISHFHGDHFYGLIGFLTSLQMAGREKSLYLYGPIGLRKYLKFMQNLSHFKLAYEVVVQEVQESDKQTVWDLGDYLVTALPLQHSLFVLGFRLAEKPRPGKFNVEQAEKIGIPAGPLRGQLQKGESVVLHNGKEVHPSQLLGPEQPGKTIVICLDTRPCKNAVELANAADLLVHDGTFDESQADWADVTGHSTVVQAATIAKEAGVKKLILSHISARYEKKDKEFLLAQAKKVFPNTIIGHDLMRIKV
ncbi:MAG: ribonuclease Z, partial [bacterium]